MNTKLCCDLNTTFIGTLLATGSNSVYFTYGTQVVIILHCQLLQFHPAINNEFLVQQHTSIIIAMISIVSPICSNAIM